MQMSPRGIQFTEKEEGGVIQFVYDDSVFPTKQWKKGSPVHGHLTAGAGHLLSTAEIELWAGKPITKAQCDRWFDADNNEAEAAVTSLVKVRLKQNQFDVLCDFVFNNNRAAFASSTLLKVVNSGKMDKVPAQLLRWTKTKINGKLVESPGLQKRCADRVAYWNSPDIDVTPHPDTKVSGTPVGSPDPKHTSTLEYAQVGVGGLAGLGSFATSTGFIGVAIGTAILIAVAVAAFIIIRRQLAPK